MQVILLIIAAFIFCHAPAWAEVPPVPPSKKQRLNLDEKLKIQEQQKNKLENKVKEIEQELGGTKQRLIDVGSSIRNNEEILEDLETRIAELEKEQLSLEQTLKNDRQSIARLILALERIRRVPPEALIAKPELPLKTAQSAMLMQDIMPAIHKQAATLRINLTNLENISKDLKAKRDKALITSETLKAEHTDLSLLVDKREQLFASTHQDLEEQKQNVKRISAQAQNLQDLVRKLENEKSRSITTRKATLKQPEIALPSPGQAQLPVSGVIRVSYDELDAFGAPSKGLSIEARDGALVIAPMGGVVRFAGSFKNYGNMIILEHKNGYHSLIAGLQKIDTVVGQSVSAGEPLGLLHKGDSGRKPVLYYELRLKGEAVNPAHKFADLG